MARIGFIGLGRMGGPIAKLLVSAGHDLIVWNRSEGKTHDLVADGARAAATPAAVVERSDLVFTMVSDASALNEILTGDSGVFKATGNRPPIFDMTTISPSDSRRFAEMARANGFEMLDAPVAGGPPVAAKGELGMMIGGREDLVEMWRPILEVFTSKIVFVGENGQGSSLKLINNLILATALQASAEAIVFARRCGIDPQKVIEISSTGGAQMRIMQTRGPRMINRDFEPAATLDLLHKDVSAAIDLAAEVGTSLPAGAVVLQMIRDGRANGQGDRDMAALVTVVEKLAGLE